MTGSTSSLREIARWARFGWLRPGVERLPTPLGYYSSGFDASWRGDSDTVYGTYGRGTGRVYADLGLVNVNGYINPGVTVGCNYP